MATEDRGVTLKLDSILFGRIYSAATVVSLFAYGAFGDFWWLEVPPLGDGFDGFARGAILGALHSAGLICLAAWFEDRVEVSIEDVPEVKRKGLR